MNCPPETRKWRLDCSGFPLRLREFSEKRTASIGNLARAKISASIQVIEIHEDAGFGWVVAKKRQVALVVWLWKLACRIAEHLL